MSTKYERVYIQGLWTSAVCTAVIFAFTAYTDNYWFLLFHFANSPVLLLSAGKKVLE